MPLPVEVKNCPFEPATVNPVPPFSTATAVPLQTPDVIVPTLVKLDPIIAVFNEVPIKFPAFTEELIAVVKEVGVI